MTKWPALALRGDDALANACVEAATVVNLKQYYDLLKTTLKEHKPPKAVTRKGTKKVQY